MDTSRFSGPVNINTPFHWGTKFEPVSQMYYEYKYGVTIEEFGCIPHRENKCMGASPDGIVTTRNSDRYGRMVEIKNIYNRDITGIPKKEYWIQTQYQMECCDLYECDFLECRFKLYENESEFLQDGSFKVSEKGYYKGIIMFFYVNEEPFYEYMPFQCSESEAEAWQDEMMEKHKNDNWIRNDYWYLQEVSCVLIQRNTKWFELSKPVFIDTWNTILHEREHGYEHRNTKRPRAKKVTDNQSTLKSMITVKKQMNPLLFKYATENLEQNNSVVDDTLEKTKTTKTVTLDTQPIPDKTPKKQIKSVDKPKKSVDKPKKSSQNFIINIDTSSL